MRTTVNIDLKNADEIIKSHGLAPGGMIQKMLTSEIQRISDPFVPFDSSFLKNHVVFAHDYTWFEHVAPYARYHWFGKLMVDPQTKKGAFFNPSYGFWSRPNTQKVLTETPMKYSGAPQRGPKWVERAWAQHGDEILSNLERKLMK
ncbi:minor capsid protein [Candidatus Stoquefichus sp. SB1]|uniref:minor capsid protein n=1 Tax=Candidatus Stoquefichus sp. SB1 TaxID=1658109 RepID=UPI00067E9657|nr:minor capsid protein [Candidatus Stoquefichus sp. SB1]